MERWYLTESRSFEIDRAGKRGVSAEERVNFFVRENPRTLAHASIKSWPVRRGSDRG